MSEVVYKSVDYYRKCLIKKLIHLKVRDCSLVFDNDCEECDKDVLYINALVNQLEYCMEHDLTDEVNTIQSLLSKRCGNCTNCPDSE